MRLALKEAGLAFYEAEVPVGAILVKGNRVLAKARNARENLNDPTAHAEIMVLRDAARISDSWRLSDSTLYVTKEPCVMCAGAMINARLGRLVYGCRDIKGGAVSSLYEILNDGRLNHRVEVATGVLEDECAAILKKFFQRRR